VDPNHWRQIVANTSNNRETVLSRQEAISEIISNWQQADFEFCCSQEEREYSRAKMVESLKVLGVTQEEIDRATS
jgi:hypothetical protein